MRRIHNKLAISMRNAAFVLQLSVAGNVYADEPLPPPAPVQVCSAAGRFCAVSDPVKNVTVVFAKGSATPLWTIPGWHRWLFVADDGESVAVVYPGMNLVPADVALTQSVLFFHHRGKPVRVVTLAELYRSRSQMLRTVSHYAWADSIFLNPAGQLQVQLVDGRTLAFSMRTGQVVPRLPKGESASVRNGTPLP